MHESHKDEAGSSRYFAPFPAQTTSDMLRIAYDAEKVPNGGSSVERAVITAAGKKEPVGFAFHSKVRAAVGAQAADVGAEEPAQQTDATSACETNNSLSGCAPMRSALVGDSLLLAPSFSVVALTLGLCKVLHCPFLSTFSATFRDDRYAASSIPAATAAA